MRPPRSSNTRSPTIIAMMRNQMYSGCSSEINELRYISPYAPVLSELSVPT